MASSLDKLASNLCGASGIHCDKCKGNMELINISGNYIASLGCERCRTKKTKDLGERVLKKNFNHTSRLLGCDEKFGWWFEKVYIHTSIWMAGRNLRRQVYHRKMRFTAGLHKWLWLWTRTASLEYHGEKNLRLLSRYLLKNRCFAAGRYETFRNTCLKNYKLDTAHFYTAPGLAWKALLKTASETVSMKKGAKTLLYARTSSGLGYLQT